MTIESRQKVINVEFDAIDSITETKDGRLQIIYMLPNSDGNGFSKKNDTFDCFEIADILKVFSSVRTIVENAVSAQEDGVGGSPDK